MNRSLTTIAVLIALFIGQSYTNARAEGEAKHILYLHWFHPTFGQQVVVDPHAPKDTTPATPPSRLMTLKVNVGIPFEFIDSRAHGMSGQIMADGDSHRVTMEGGFGSGARFSGRVELEKVFDPEITWFSGGVFPCRFVFSENKDITPFLRAQSEIDAKNITPLLRTQTEIDAKNQLEAMRLIQRDLDRGLERNAEKESKIIDDAPKGFVHVTGASSSLTAHHYIKVNTLTQIQQFSEEDDGKLLHHIWLNGAGGIVAKLEFSTKEEADRVRVKILELMSAKN